MSKYICFDTETCGLNSCVNNLLTACFIILDKNLNEIDRLNLSIKYDQYNVNIKALEINKIDLIQHHNDINTVDIHTAQKHLIYFLEKNKNEYNHPLIPIFHNGNFDINFIHNSYLLPKEIYNNYISYYCIDTLMITQFLKLHKKIPNKQNISLIQLSNYFNITKDPNLQHTSEYDAEITIQLLKEYLKLFN